MLLSKSSCVCIPSFKSVAPKVCLTKVPFVTPFFCLIGTQVLVWSYTCTQNTPQIILIPNIYGFMGLTP